ncbi:hypothetical protein [Roseibium algae]|uniref:Secreted protein with PEP-CTERM sorting signal n=1 Tax=Roseibium algae TaxID=3123038 RepID=A0ABU8TL73_9HYPH
MNKVILGLSAFAVSASSALAHTSLQDHAHPHTDASSYFTVEMLIIFALGISLGGTLAWVRRRKEGGK